MKKCNNREETELIRRLQRGDLLAFDLIFGKYRRQILAYVSGLIMDRAGAEDITQSCFIELARNIEKIDPKKGVSGWLYRVARNKSIDYLRKRNRETVTDRAGYAEMIWKDPAFEADRSERFERLGKALAGLDAEERDILSLRFFGDLKFREIASVVGKPLGTVLWRSRKALEKMRQELDTE